MAWVEIPAKYLTVKERIQRAEVPGLTFCLVYHEGRWIAFSKKCPHAGAPLEQGWLEDGMLVCAYHRQRFDLKTGRGMLGQGNFITIYPTEQINGKWSIQMKPGFFKRLFSGGSAE